MVEYVPLMLVIFMVVFGLFEYKSHRINLSRIPIRIHVNGTRGKSSVTRLVAAGLRGGGVRVLAKTTGTAASIIYSDGNVVPIQRRGKPDVGEQLEVFREAVKEKVQAVVIECMAIRPDLQRVCETKMVHATHSIISNIRPDHLDVMGPGVKDVAIALSETLPTAGNVCYTSETNDDMLNILREKAEPRDIEIQKTDSVVVTNEMMQGFSYFEHKENVALALALCREFGIKDEVALEGMYHAEPDPGVLRTNQFFYKGKEFEFINAFAANDPASILNIWIRMSRGFKDHQTRIILLNTRKERLQRSQQLAKFIATHIECDYVFLTGDDQRVIKRHLKDYLTRPCHVVACGKEPVRYVYRRLIRVSEKGGILFGIGNVGGVGHSIVNLFNRIEKKHGKK